MLLVALPVQSQQMSSDNCGHFQVTPGKIVELRQSTAPGLEYLLYVPKNSSSDTPVLVIVHGISRDAEEQITLFQRYADEQKFILLAPRFTKSHYADYQRLGRPARGGFRADLALKQLVQELPFNSIDRGLFLFGYSGGGQFVHRFVMAHPELVNSAVVAAPGWYTMPDPKAKYPYGLRVGPNLPSVSLQPDRFAHIPVLVVVGDKDTERDENLRRSNKLDRRQGLTRVDRAQRWVAAMNDTAQRHDANTGYRVALLKGVGHSYAESMRAGMGDLIFEFFRQYQLTSLNLSGEDLCVV